MTSPPFALVKKKKYGNVSSEEYLDWFRPFIKEIYRVLTKDGSFVLDIGGSWVKGSPTKSLYQFELMIMIVKEFGFHLAQDFYWYNPSKLPTPAEWVTIRRIRVKDAVNTVWWFSKAEFPKANNKNILKPYSKSMEDLLKNGYKPNLRPSGHNISDKFQTDNKGAIPPNLIDLANTESSSTYLNLCKNYNLEAHPARFPIALPELFIKFLTHENDIVFDPFGGSNTTGEACEINNRRWLISELNEDYLKGSMFRFNSPFSTLNNL
ncbi:DNA-methyltransferase [Mesobacillus jeotgali]|uniref:DNA-methyltransferase n=1 Tax=Mesobacillus jeotgali TaxID=129985 RepID=UPI00177BA1CF|nr:site-specific DNA-methyltransferase [Mesobacillus jeotgali]UYZ22031.1 site-specific DNA-methyltransferase [Mesobacillus jeotgali]